MFSERDLACKQCSPGEGVGFYRVRSRLSQISRSFQVTAPNVISLKPFVGLNYSYSMLVDLVNTGCDSDGSTCHRYPMLYTEYAISHSNLYTMFTKSRCIYSVLQVISGNVIFTLQL